VGATNFAAGDLKEMLFGNRMLTAPHVTLPERNVRPRLDDSVIENDLPELPSVHEDDLSRGFVTPGVDQQPAPAFDDFFPDDYAPDHTFDQSAVSVNQTDDTIAAVRTR
jgi:hypothetical protein